MRAEERHELRENELAKALVSVRAFLEEKGKTLAIALLGIVAIFAAITFASSSRTAKIESAWRSKGELKFGTPVEAKESIRKLSVLVSETSDPAFVQSALLEQGTQALRLSQQSEIPPDPELNDMARAAFEQLLQRSRGNLFGFAAAHAGLATVSENDFAIDQNPNHKEVAEKHLKEIVNNTNLQTTPFFALATDRLANLNKTFEVVRFAATPPPPPAPAPTPAPTPATQPAGQPVTLQAVPIPVKAAQPAPGEEPAEARQLMKVRVGEDGTIEVVPEDEE